MKVENSSIQGVWTIRPESHQDRRGSFLELFNERAVEALSGRSFRVAQVNTSTSKHNVVRGIHAVRVPPGQAKYVTCTSGEILDCVVDLRTNSRTFSQWDAVVLNASSHLCLLVEEGIGHAFQVLSESATVVYATSSIYDPTREYSINPLDVGLGLPWVGSDDLILSDRDRDAPSLDEAIRRGLLR